MLLRERFQLGHIVSYGSCQFPTLGFVVDRWRRIKDFVPNPFWSIDMEIKKMCPMDRREKKVRFNWSRVKLFDRELASVFYLICADNPVVTIEECDFREKRKFKPYPLTTIEMQKLATTKLRWTAAKVMDVAEKLYQAGFISYPRTETNKYPPTIHLQTLVANQQESGVWGQYAQNLLDPENRNAGNAFQSPR